jgi:hypothetical protein
MKTDYTSKANLPLKSRTVDREAWLSQFEHVPDSELSARQLTFLESFRRTYPTAAAGRKNSALHIYAFEEGRPFCGLMPLG